MTVVRNCAMLDLLAGRILALRPPGHKHRSAAGYFDSLEKYIEDGYDFASFRRLVLDPAGPGGSRRCRLALWRSPEDEPYPERWVTLDDDAVLVAEGGFLFLPEFQPSWDFTIWLDIDTQTRPQAYADAVVGNRRPEQPVLIRLNGWSTYR